jgi:hypothetical protein
MSAQIKLSYFVIKMAGLKSAQRKVYAVHTNCQASTVGLHEKCQSGTRTFHQFVNRFDFSIQALEINAFVFSL